MSEPTWENVLSRLKPWVRGRRDSAEKLDQAARHTSYDARVGAPSAKKRNDGVLLNSRSHRWSVQLAGRNNVTSRSFEEAANTSGPMGGAGVALFHQLQDLSQNLSPSEESLIEYISDSDAAAEDGNPRRKARHERGELCRAKIFLLLIVSKQTAKRSLL